MEIKKYIKKVWKIDWKKAWNAILGFVIFVLVVSLVNDTYIACKTHINVVEKNHIYLHDFDMPTALVNSGVSSGHAVNETLKVIKVYETTPELIDEKVVYAVLPSGWLANLASIIPALLNRIGMELTPNWSGLVGSLHKWIFNSEGIVQGKVIHEDDIYLSQLVFSNQPETVLENRKIKSIWHGNAKAIVSTFQPCKAVVFSFNISEKIDFSSLSACRKKLPEKKNWDLFYTAMYQIREGNLLVANKLLDESIGIEVVNTDVVRIAQHVKTQLFLADKISDEEFTKFLDSNGEYIKKDVLYITARLLQNIYILNDAKKAKYYLDILAEDPSIGKLIFSGNESKQDHLDNLRSESHNGNNIANILLYYSLGSSDLEKQERVMLAKNAVKESSIWGLIEPFSRLGDPADSNYNNQLIDIKKWLADPSLLSSPYVKILSDLTNLLLERGGCQEFYTHFDFTESLKLFKNLNQQDAFSYFYQGLIYKHGLSGEIDEDEASYYFHKAKVSSLNLQIFPKYNFEVLYLLFGPNQDIDRGLVKLDNLLKIYAAIAKAVGLSNLISVSEDFSYNKVLDTLSGLDALSLEYKNACFSNVEFYTIPQNQEGPEVLYNNAIAHYLGRTITSSKFYVPIPKNYDYAFVDFYFANYDDFADAQYFLAKMYSNGQGVKKSCIKSKYWMDKAIHNKSKLAAITKLANCNYTGLDFKTEILQ